MESSLNNDPEGHNTYLGCILIPATGLLLFLRVFDRRPIARFALSTNFFLLTGAWRGPMELTEIKSS